MSGAERTRRRLRTELHKRGIRINRLPEFIPYAANTCYNYLSGKTAMSQEFAAAVQRVIDQWDNNRKSARP